MVDRQALGSDGLWVSSVCVGTSPLGGTPEQAVATLVSALESPLNFLDTSNEYGDGESERRIGAALRQSSVMRDDIVIASKADPARDSRVFDSGRVVESYAESIGRLGVDRLDVFYLHDPERFDFDYVTRGGALDALCDLKASRKVGLIGVAGGAIPEMHRYLDTGVVDVLLNHNQFTLLDQSAEPLIDHALSVGASFVNAAPYASGILAKPLTDNPRYQYRTPSPDIIEKVTRLRMICAQHDVPLAALALQFSTRDSRVASTVVGVSSPARVGQLVDNAAIHLPAALWDAVGERLGFEPPGRT
jgi:D-threo-aldose 1-dehydrogenase